ncbi:CYFIP-related Rac1 interactor A isoform X1 [Acipenser ruthenus]|uniref:CYFIP-related Rac1 interactor A isoform X1 n=1 Tax=Acipenser ruthenus TaxID=7906 RepID=UPI00145AE243|nr:CYFIP-related Rac1 interactor A isoform X1 [Acipenser ruthenus]
MLSNDVVTKAGLTSLAAAGEGCRKRKKKRSAVLWSVPLNYERKERESSAALNKGRVETLRIDCLLYTNRFQNLTSPRKQGYADAIKSKTLKLKSFSNAQPTDCERDVWNQVNAVLQDSESILLGLQAYKGAGQEIREGIQNPSDFQLQERAWNAVCPLVIKLKRFYEFSLRLEKALQSLLESLTCPPYTPTQHLEREQALAKQFAEILHFTLRFDELKMRNPAIQNDFSYYRRTISRNRINNMNIEIESEVNNEMANRMSLFYAEATPMLKTLSNATTNFVFENKTLPLENTTDCLSTMASVCKVMLETPDYTSRFNSEDTQLFCMRVMVGVIILYDHVHPAGAFTKASKIDMKGCIKVLKEQPADNVEGLVNALKFTTKHLNDETTPKAVRAMLQ